MKTLKLLCLLFALTLTYDSCLGQTTNPASVSNQTLPPSVTSSVSNQTQQTVATPAMSNLVQPIAKDNPDYTKYAAIIISIVTLVYTFLKDRKTEVRLHKVEEQQEREKAQAALRRSRASAPFFSPSRKLFGQVYDTNEEGIIAWHSMAENLLSTQRNQVSKELADKYPIIMVLDTGGKGARRIEISGDIPEFELRQEPDLNGAHELVFAKYPYAPANHGKIQKVILTFETEDGLELTHTYQTKHGFFEFFRIDPK